MLKWPLLPAFSCVAVVLLNLFPPSAHAADTQFLYLSGKGKDDPVKWDFMCSAGQNSGKWSTIGVPSNWELQGFGIYTYGTDRKNPWPKVQGQYKRTFATPANWNDKQIFIVFDGVMTDTQVSINGQSAGAMHQGGYYRFKYDVTKLLKPAGAENQIDVTVDDESSTPSVNNAERRGDYWNYAGIFRPVYLEALPLQSIERVAIDAKADGSLNASVYMNGFPHGSLHLEDWTVEGQVFDMKGAAIGAPMKQAYKADGTDPFPQLSSKFNGVQAWNAEVPTLYQLELRLKDGDEVVHSLRQKFGFRTVEVRPGEGLFVNGSRIMLKGADRHSFWPDSGRTLSEKVSRDDIALMKEMNMNAVRCSHYPPDQHFLDACDELGMYVLDELAGWHQAYDTTTGHRLVGEMITRDVNHPSILFWDNGNEGGWNTALDNDFAQWDPQKRLVIHPQQTQAAKGLDNSHYPQYNAVVTKSAANNVFFPTEMLHGLYDGGHGAGLEDYWKVMMAGKATAGGFLWSLNDEDIVRTDKGGKLDSNGNQAPDGILGPYREKEGSFYTVKQLWSPIVSSGVVTSIASGNISTQTMPIENRYDFVNAKECSFQWEIRKLHAPNEQASSSDLLSSGQVDVDSIPPHSKGNIHWNTPLTMMGNLAETVHVFGPDKRELTTFDVPHGFGAGPDFRALPLVAASAVIKADDAGDTLKASAAELALTFDKKTGLLAAASRAGKTFSFINGPRLLAAYPTPAAPARGAAPATPLPPLPDAALSSLTQKIDGNDLLISATFAPTAAGETPALQGMKSITYRLRPNGWLTIDYAYTLTGPHEYFGVGFDYPEANVKGMRYLGNGPATVYQNRLAGGTLDVWEKKYNNTMVGDPDDLKPGEHFDYPIFKGYYAGVRWLQLKTTEGPITALLNQDDLLVQVFKPKTPPANQIGQTGVAFPDAGISFLHAIPAIGSKFTGPKTTGPQGQPAVAKGDYKGSISLYFGELH